MSSSIPPAVALAEVPSNDDQALPRRRLVFFIVAIALFMASIDQTIVATALSTIHRELHSGIEWSSWTITIYALGQILVMPLAGKLSDMYGRKRIFVSAVILFTIASLLCGLSTNIYMLVALRAAQAIGGGAFMPSATGIVADHFGRNRDRALGMFTSIFPIGGIIGPVLGGLFVTGWSWRGIFLVNVPIGAILIVLAVVFLPKGSLRPSKRLDVWGVVLLGSLLLSAMFGITLLGDGSTSLLGVGFLLPEGIAIAALVLFVLRMKYAESPFIPLRLLRGGGFGVMNLINFLYGAAALGFGALVPLYAQDRFGIPVLQAGTLLTARAVGVVCVAGLAVLALRRTGYRLPMVVGFAVMAAGLASMALKPPGVSPYLWLTLSGAIAGIGMGLSVPATNNATMQLARDQLAGVAGLRGMFRQSGSIMGVSITTAILASSTNPGETLSTVFIVFAAILVCVVVPVVFLVPEHRGRW
ncbi:MAG TPA: MFS transporter [Galbitalea sp.]|nr:MFS transporter [Galbitalea sp.]